MLFGSNLKQASSYNRRVVLQTVRQHGPLSKAEIARETNLTNQTISIIVNKLIDENILVVTGKREGKRGQPAQELELNPDGAYTLGFHLEKEQLIGLLMDLKGQTRKHVFLKHDAPKMDEVIVKMTKYSEVLIRQTAIAQERILGVGFAFPGPFRAHQAPAEFAPTYPLWGKKDVKLVLEQQLGYPVFIEDSSAASAIEEWFLGKGQGMKHFFYVFIGLGIGGGAIINGQPYRGVAGNATEFGHLCIEQDGRPCRCGGRGCLERYVSIRELLRFLHQDGLGDIELYDLQALFEVQEPKVLEWLEYAAKKMAVALINVENFMEPETIFFGGRLPENMLSHFIKLLEKAMGPLRMSHKPIQPQYLMASNKEFSAAIGAAVLPIYHFLFPQHKNLLIQ
jgi:predicted NBD/HSP70 family sugar kinase